VVIIILEYITAIQQYIKSSPALTIIFTILGTSMVWLYREHRNNIIANIKQSIDEISDTLMVYGKLESSIIIYLKYKSSELESIVIEVFGQSGVVLSDRIRKVYLSNHVEDENKYKLLLTLIQSEIYELRNKLSERKVESKVDDTEKFITRIVVPTKPIIYLLFVSFVVFICIVLWYQSNNWFFRANVICFGYSFAFGMYFLKFLLNELIDNKLRKRSKKYIILCCLLSFIPVITFFMINLSFITLTIQIVVVFIISRHLSITKTLEIVRNNNFR
jgi:hypothetical protein